MAEIRLSASNKIEVSQVMKGSKNPPMKHGLQISSLIGLNGPGGLPNGNFNDPGFSIGGVGFKNAAHSFGVKPAVYSINNGNGSALAYNLKCLNIAKMVVNREKFSALKHSNGVDLIYPDITGTYILGFAKGTGPFSGNGSPYSKYATFSFESTTGSDIQTWAETTPVYSLPGSPFILKSGEMTFTGGPLKDSDILVTYNVPGVPNLRKIIQTGSYFLTYVDRDSGDLINVSSIKGVTFRSAFVFQSQHTDHDVGGINTYRNHNYGDLYYPLIDSLSALMKWYQDLNTFHGWGLPPFKIIDINGVSRNFTPTDCTTVLNIEDYELYGEPWHFENTLYHIIEWLNLLARILGVNYWEDLITRLHRYTGIPFDEYTRTRFLEDINKGKYARNDYYKLFPSLQEYKPQNSLGYNAVTMIRAKIYKESYASRPRNDILELYNNDKFNFLAGAARRITHPYLGTIVFKIIKHYQNTVLAVSDDWIPYEGLDAGAITTAIGDLGYDVKRVSQHWGLVGPATGPFGSLSEFLIEFNSNLNSYGYDTFPYVVSKFELEPDPPNMQAYIRKAQTQMSPIALGEVDLLSLFNSRQYYYGNNGLYYGLTVKESMYFNHRGAANFPSETVQISTFLLGGNSMLKRYGIKGSAICRIKKYPLTIKTNTPDIFNIGEAITVSFYIGKTSEFSTLFSPAQFGQSRVLYDLIGNQQEDEDMFLKIRTILEAGTKIYEYTFSSDAEEVDIDLSEFLGYDEQVSSFIGMVVRFDETTLDLINMSDCVHRQFESINGTYELAIPFYSRNVGSMIHHRDKNVEGIRPFVDGVQTPEHYIDFGIAKLYLTLDGPVYK